MNLSCDSLGRNDACQLCQSQITQLSDSVRALRGICLMMWLLKGASGPKRTSLCTVIRLNQKCEMCRISYDIPSLWAEIHRGLRSCFTVIALITWESCYEGKKLNVCVCVQPLLEAVQHYVLWSKQSLIILLSALLTVKLLNIVQRMSSHRQFLGILVHFNVANCRHIT